MANRKTVAAQQETDTPCSVSPAGERFPIPRQQDYAAEFERIKKLAERARAEGREIVVVMGVGFVGAVMAAIIADTTDEKGAAGNSSSGARGRAPAVTGKSPSSTGARHRSPPRTRRCRPLSSAAWRTKKP